MFHIIAEDLAKALITPFSTLEEAEAHIRFCAERGDSASHVIINDEDLSHCDADDFALIMSPSEDRDFDNTLAPEPLYDMDGGFYFAPEDDHE